MFGLQQADDYHEALEQQFRSLAKNPRMGRRRSELDPPVRILPVMSHLIIYTVDENDKVFIIRVRHRREDWEADGPGF